MNQGRSRVYARAAAPALALLAMLVDPAWQPGGTPRAQAPSLAAQIAPATAAAPAQLRPSLLVLISSPGTGDLVVFDAATRKELKRFQVGEAAVGIAVSSDSRRAYVASMATGKVTAVDLETLTPAGSVQTGQAPDGLAWVGEE